MKSLQENLKETYFTQQVDIQYRKPNTSENTFSCYHTSIISLLLLTIRSSDGVFTYIGI